MLQQGGIQSLERGVHFVKNVEGKKKKREARSVKDAAISL